MLLVTLLILAVSSSQPAAEQIVERPSWVRRPTQAELMLAFPRAARAQGVSGRAAMSCTVELDGKLADCSVVRETPPGWGFGRAILLTRDFFRLSPKKVNGQPVAGGKVTIPLTFHSFGTVEMRCRRWDSGIARECRVVSESPRARGLGFEALAHVEGRPISSPSAKIKDGELRRTLNVPIPVRECVPRRGVTCPPPT